MRATAQENLMCSSRPTWKRSLCLFEFFFMEARLTALENRLRQTERALVVERLARQTAEVAQQTVGTWPAAVDAEEIGTLPMFSGDIDLSGRTDSMPWSQWSLTIGNYFGKFNRTTAWMLQQVETSVDDPIITDNTVMTRTEKRCSAQACSVLALTRGKALQVVQRVPRGFGFEASRQLYEKFEPRPPAKSQEMCQALKAGRHEVHDFTEDHKKNGAGPEPPLYLQGYASEG